MYRCQICKAVSQPGGLMLRHQVLKPDGNIKTEIPVCGECSRELKAGATVKALVERHLGDPLPLPKPKPPPAPPYVPLAELAAQQNPVGDPDPAQPLTPAPPLTLLIGRPIPSIRVVRGLPARPERIPRKTSKRKPPKRPNKND